MDRTAASVGNPTAFYLFNAAAGTSKCRPQCYLQECSTLASDPAFHQMAIAQPAPNRDETLTEKAERCRRLAAGISDRQAADVLRSMALQYEDSAARLEV